MYKNLLEKANNQVWDALFREVMDYPNTTLRVMNNLKSINWISDLRYEDAKWIVKESLGKDTISFSDLYDLFHKEQN